MLKYGLADELQQPLVLQAGDLTLHYAHGFIRYIKAGDAEVLRMINHLIRDQNWYTIHQVIENEKIETNKDSFRINYTCRARQHPVDFLWECQIEGTSESRLKFVINGKALSAFKRNRMGFTVLHPSRECRGQPVTISHSDGTTEDLEFPELISPHQPFFDIKAMQWNIGSIEAKMQFFGEVFETEDQRNWTDDSYKTYCTPLALPFPKQLEAGDTVSQKIELAVTSRAERSIPADSKIGLSFEVWPEEYQLPRIGIARSYGTDRLTSDQLNLLKQVKFDLYQVDLELGDKGWISTLDAAIDEAGELGLGLELSLFFQNTGSEVDEFIAAARDLGSKPEIIHLFEHRSQYTSEQTINQTVPKLKTVFPGASIGAGTNAFFTELNRNRVDHRKLDHLVYSINPQVHAFDNLSLVESLYAQPDTVNTAISFAGERAVRISPITLKMRWNPNATETTAADPVAGADPRQSTLFGACWLLGSIQNLVGTGLHSVTYFETVGPKGIIQYERPSNELSAIPFAALYPMYFVFKYLLDRKERIFRPIRSSHPLSLGGLAIEPGELVLANFTDQDISVILPEEWKNCQGYFIDTDNVWQLMTRQIQIENTITRRFRAEITLKAYGLAFLHR